MGDLLKLLQDRLDPAYRVEREMGGGGMSRVFEAEERSLGRRVVIKVLAPELAAEVSAERFRREIRLAAQLQHPHIVPVLSAGEANGLLYYTMPLVEGESLRARLEREVELPVAAAVRVLRDVADALAHAHSHGLVHRDIKPENVLLTVGHTSRVGHGHALVTDFGVARAIASASDSPALTSTGLAVGTPAYMAPEQAAADRHLDHRADLYALGVLAYEMLAGSPPFVGPSTHAVLAAHISTPPEPVTARRAGIPPQLDALVMRCLEKRAADRWQTAEEMLGRLEAIGTSAALAEVTPTPRGRRSAPLAARAARWSSRPVIGPHALGYVLGGLLLIAAAYAVVFTWPGRGSPDDGPRASGVAAATSSPATKSIAVLPFVDRSPGGDNEYFSDGMTEELIGTLAKLQGLRVASRTSAFAFKGKNADIAEIGRKLGVATVLEGSVRQAGNRLRITAQLTDVKGGYHLWSETYDREVRDVLAIQSEIAQSIVRALEVSLGTRDRAVMAAPHAVNLEAFNLYLKGRFFWSKRTAQHLRQAVEYFERAIRADSTYAPAYAGLADSWDLLATYGHSPSKTAQAKARAATLKALQLDSTLAEAHAALAQQRKTEWDWPGAERAFKRAIDLKPSYATAHQWYALLLAQLGRHEDAIREIRRAQELDPLSPVIRGGVTTVLTYARRHGEALEQARATVELHPDFYWAYLDLGDVLEKMGRYSEAIEAYRRAGALAPGDPNAAGFLAHALAVAGRRAEARRILDGLARRPNPPAALIARVHVALGEHDEAFAWLERAYESRDGWLEFIGILGLDTLRSDPRFTRLLTRLRLVP